MADGEGLYLRPKRRRFQGPSSNIQRKGPEGYPHKCAFVGITPRIFWGLKTEVGYIGNEADARRLQMNSCVSAGRRKSARGLAQSKACGAEAGLGGGTPSSTAGSRPVATKAVGICRVSSNKREAAPSSRFKVAEPCDYVPPLPPPRRRYGGTIPSPLLRLRSEERVTESQFVAFHRVMAVRWKNRGRRRERGRLRLGCQAIVFSFDLRRRRINFGAWIIHLDF